MFTSTTKARMKMTGVMFAGIMTLAVVTNIDLVKGVQNLWTQTGNVITLTNGANRTLSLESSLSSGATSVEGFTQGGDATALTDANGGAYVLTEAQLIASGTFEMVASGAGMEVVALTMPATSTMTTLMPNAGDCRTWLYDASALATATTTTMTKGDGHNIIAYTTDDDVIDGEEFSQIQMCRKINGDVNTIVTELLHAD